MTDRTPRRKTLWLLFDLSNGDRGSYRYVWWLDTRKDALRHRREQHRKPFHARLSLPRKARLE